MQLGIFMSLGIGFLSGIITGIFLLPQQLIQRWGTVCIIIILSSLVIKKITRYRTSIPVVLTLSLGLVIGLWRISEFHSIYPFSQLVHYNESTVSIVGKVYKSPEIKPDKQLVLVTPLIINGEKISKQTQKISARVTLFHKILPGDIVHISGKFQVRSDFISDTGRIVPYRIMSYSKKIAGDIYYPTIFTIVGHDKNMYTFLSLIKNKFLESMNNLFVLPASGLLSGMMIGDTSSLSPDMLDIFRMVGLIHIVVLSGYNVTLVANTFVRMFAFRGYYGRLLFAMIALVIFIGVVGVSQTALRAGIMALCLFSAQYFIRPYMIGRALLVALVIMVWVSPYSILFDLSLQLSFLATLGIVYLFPILKNKYEKLSENFLGEIVLQTIAVNILVLPLILYQIGSVSPVFLPLNVLVLGFVPFLTIGGFIVTAIGFVSSSIAIIGAYPIQFMTDSIIRLAQWTSQHDPFYIILEPFSLKILIGVYGCVLIYLIIKNSRQNVSNTIM